MLRHPIDEIGFVKLINEHKDSGLSIVNAARCSYGSTSSEFTDKDKKLVKYLWNNEHTSPFRHNFYTFHIKAPLFVFRQWIKYQVGAVWRTFEIGQQPVSLEVFEELFDTDKGCSWNELSGRYKELEPEFYIPLKLRSNVIHGSSQAANDYIGELEEESIFEMIRDKIRADYEFYRELLEDGVAKELARIILPQNIYTQSYWTVSLQAVLHFLKQRLAPDAQYEIRKYAEAIKDILQADLDKLGVEL